MALHHVAYMVGVDSTFRDLWVLQLLHTRNASGVNVEV